SLRARAPSSSKVCIGDRRAVVAWVMSASRAWRETRTPRERSISAMSSVGIVGLQVVGDDVSVGDMVAEVDVDGDEPVVGTPLVLAEHGEGAGVVGATSDGLAGGSAEDVDAVQVEQVRGLGDHEADVAARFDPALKEDVEAGDRGVEPVTPLGITGGAL